jgi:cyclopropane fatty-acyl-phospholipid synthase-like methyltransferase
MTRGWKMLRRGYRLLSSSVRESRFAAALKEILFGSFAGHDLTYNGTHYADMGEGPAASSALVISESFLRDLQPTTVVDVGCGTGALLEALQKRGSQVMGLEKSRAALRCCRERGLDVGRFDLGRGVFAEGHVFDVAISMEVAEHLPERTADRYVESLARLSRLVVFTAAPPGQGGHHHVNEQPPSHWIAKFQGLGFEQDQELSQRGRESWRGSETVAPWYPKNPMVFRRAPKSDLG